MYPYVAIDAVRSWHGSKRTIVQMEKGTIPSVTLEQAQANYAFAIDKGLKKVLAKMGISMLSSYHGAQIFEAIGIGDDLLARGVLKRSEHPAARVFDQGGGGGAHGDYPFF